MKKIMVAFMVVILCCTMLLGLVGCEKTDKEKENQNQEEKTISVWWSQEEGDLTLINDAWNDFYQLYTKGDKKKYDENIKMATVPGDPGGTTTLEMQISGGTAPDVVKMDHVYITALGQSGKLLDLNKEFYADEKIKNQFIESCWNASTYENSTYGIPFDAHTIIWGGKKTVLDVVGVTLPINYEQLIDVSGKLKTSNLEDNIYPYTITGGVDTRYSWPTITFVHFLYREGGDYLNMEDENGDGYPDMDKAVFNDPETGVKALEKIIRLKEEGFVSPTEHQDNSILGDYETWRMNSFTEDMEFDLLPTIKEGVPRWSQLSVYSLAVVNTSEKKELAYDFAVHLATERSSSTDEYYQYTFTKSHSSLPSLKAATANRDFGDKIKNNFWNVSIEQLELSKYRPAVSCWPRIEEILYKAVSEAIRGDKEPQAALDEAAGKVDALLAKGNG